ncbi:MAG: ELWxxDGT repeat protein [Chloroflexota bacterium]
MKSTHVRKLFGTISVTLAFVLIAAMPARAASVPTWTVIDTIKPGPDGSGALDSGNSIAFKGFVYFAANTDAHGLELWRSNGTTTELVKDINGENAGMDSSSPSRFAILGNWLYFRADDGVHGRELWRTDGTAANTTMVKDINSDGNSNPDNLTAFGGLLYFSATDTAHGNELWKSDGTAAGTVLVADINLLDGGANSSGPYNLTPLNGWLYFDANDGVHGYELWKTDGTTAHTSLVKDIRDGAEASGPDSLTVYNGALYFSADDGVHGNELWKSDGTAAHTAMLEDINPNNTGADSSEPYGFAVLGQTLFFTAADGTHGREVWRTDGTEANTTMVMDIYPDSDSSYPEPLVPLGDFVYFNAYSESGPGVWRTDGTTTEAVPFPVAGQENACDCYDTALIAVGGRLFSTINSDDIGHEFAYLDEASYALPSTNREVSDWTVAFVILAGLTAAASISVRVREAKRT